MAGINVYIDACSGVGNCSNALINVIVHLSANKLYIGTTNVIIYRGVPVPLHHPANFSISNQELKSNKTFRFRLTKRWLKRKKQAGSDHGRQGEHPADE
ncbi:hypothetical protein quinque_008736 [Culex quinquefasciatus]